MTPERTGAIVLAGGRSSRFGRDKLAAAIGGRPLLDHAIEAVQAVATDVVVVLAPGTTRALPDGVAIAHDFTADEGPLAGVVAGLAALPASIDVVVIVGGDMPTLRPAVLALLAQTVRDDPAVAAAVLDMGGPMPMAVRRTLAAATAVDIFTAGERRLRALPERLGTTVLSGATWRALDPDALTVRDVDVPSDLPSDRRGTAG